MGSDWKDILGRLRDDPSLPEGEEMHETLVPETVNPQGTLRVILDRKGRKGKTATIIEGFTLDEKRVAEIAAMLKKKLGVGGSQRGGEILIQGDFVAKSAELLRKEGFKVKT